MREGYLGLFFLTSIFSLGTLIISIIALVRTSPPHVSPIKSRIFSVPRHAKMIKKDVYHMQGYSKKHGKQMDGFIFVSNMNSHKNNTKERHRHKPSAKTSKITLPCTGPITPGARWRVVEPYMVDSTNINSMSDAFVKNTIDTSIHTWLAHITSIQPLSSITSGLVDGIDTNNPDGKNEILFGPITDVGVIAMTIVWISGTSIIETDQIYNDEAFVFGDATLDSSKMDFQTIATHELGHALGLIDQYDPSCSSVVMYGSATEGLIKRSLTSYDINGLQDLYGELPQDIIGSTGSRCFLNYATLSIILLNIVYLF